MSSDGSAATIRFCEEIGKPCLQNPPPQQLCAWLDKYRIRVLNVAGNRASRNPDVGRVVERVLRAALQIIQAPGPADP
jgi:hypothetical protein